MSIVKIKSHFFKSLISRLGRNLNFSPSSVVQSLFFFLRIQAIPAPDVSIAVTIRPI